MWWQLCLHCKNSSTTSIISTFSKNYFNYSKLTSISILRCNSLFPPYFWKQNTLLDTSNVWANYISERGKIILIVLGRCPCPNSRNIQVCYLTWQNGLSAMIEDIEMGKLFWIGGPHVISRVLVNKRKSRRVSEWRSVGGLGQPPLALQRERGNQGTWCSRHWNRQGDEFEHSDSSFGILTSRTGKE